MLLFTELLGPAAMETVDFQLAAFSYTLMKDCEMHRQGTYNIIYFINKLTKN